MQKKKHNFVKYFSRQGSCGGPCGPLPLSPATACMVNTEGETLPAWFHHQPQDTRQLVDTSENITS